MPPNTGVWLSHNGKGCLGTLFDFVDLGVRFCNELLNKTNTMNHSIRFVLLALLLLTAVFGVRAQARAQGVPLEGFWFNDKKDAKIQIYKATDGKFYGKIVWLKE